MKWLRKYGGHPVGGDPSNLNIGLKRGPNKSGTGQVGFLSLCVNLLKKRFWHTDIESNRVRCGHLAFGPFCFSHSFCGFFRLCFCSHSVFPFQLEMKYLFTTWDTIIQPFFVGCRWFHLVVTLKASKRKGRDYGQSNAY